VNAQLFFIVSAALLLAVGLWLSLPRGPAATGRAIGAVLVAIGLGLLASQTLSLDRGLADALYYILAGITVFSAAATISFRNPVYSAIWFALALLGTASLFLFNGAQFLGVATIVVYAGAILVTFLFVLMLAQPEGHAPYDRVSWGASLSAVSGAVLVGMLTLVLVSVFQNPVVEERPIAVADQAQLAEGVLADQHMAGLGGWLFSKNLLSIEVAGTLLLVALVGCVAIVAQVHRRQRGGPMHG
jgi:NADH-quinone oxidoreductase subunit J